MTDKGRFKYKKQAIVDNHKVILDNIIRQTLAYFVCR